ncbi:hypothetical protein FACS1894198_3900 [Clostridia bacterium]|nr:hypothetical protein FACS1894198_3900 [Clostridia bacterium]
MNDISNWSDLTTNSQVLVMVLALTQFTKGIPLINRIPTQIWSYILSLLVLIPATYFNRGLNASSIVLIFFNAVLISLEANGSYAAIKRIASGTTN